MNHQVLTYHYRPLLAIIVLTMVLMCSCQGNSTSGRNKHPQVPPRNEQAKYDGIDISSHQGYIDWAKVSSDKDIRFVYIKATEGATYRSPHYVHNLTQARRYGLLVVIPMLDVEVRGDWSRSQLIDSVEKFCQLTEDFYGVQPMIYSTMGFYNKNLAPHFNKHRLYIGRYSNEEPEINWEGEYTIWQYSETGIIPGIDAYVDLCRYSKDGWIDDILLPEK